MELWGFCILLMLLYFSSSSAARSLGNETDRTALLDIKFKMNDPDGFFSSWNASQHHCHWPGVSCNVRHGRVTNLTLQSSSLSGTISPHIGNLSFMKGILLGDNLLQGEIPQQIGRLSRLRVFNMSYNLLSGEIPVNLTRCAQLRHIDLSRNQLTREIPAELGFLNKLEILFIFSNNLTGRIPASLANLSSSLVQISSGFNNLEGHIPYELGSLRKLIFFGFGKNHLSGQIPPSLFNISTLKGFTLACNSLSGRLPSYFGLNLPVLIKLELGVNNFSGEIPASLINCTNLKRLDLSGNKFRGKVPSDVGKLLNLQELNLEHNLIHENIHDLLVPLTNCTDLDMLSVNSNKFSGKLPSSIGNLSQLQELYVSRNEISGVIPVELGDLVKLQGLVLGENFLTGVIPESLTKLQNLEVLSLFSSNLSGRIPSKLCNNMTKLYKLELGDNNLGGDLSHSLANCDSIQFLSIYGNKLSGCIPSHMFGLHASPIDLDLSNNSFSGTLTFEVGKLTNLRLLNVSHNRLDGHIPSTIGGCAALTSLYMNNNNFSGSLPPKMASLTGVEELDLSDNNLTGPIPRGLIKLVHLTYLNLSYNNLEGEVPTDGIFSNASRIMLQGNNLLCGGISDLGLPACPVVRRKTKWKTYLKIILIPLLSLLMLSITLFTYLFLRKKGDRVREGMPPTPSEKMLRVSYNDLYRATNEFSPANLIGSGGFGSVYKGSLILENGEINVVAIKVLDLQKRGASKSFIAECKALSNLRHRNLVPLLTYCSSIDHKGNEVKALVYKYMENGSLDTWLHTDLPLKSEKCLNLLQRLNIAIDVALALDHLHNHSHVVVAHCDVKPSNILLDNGLSAYVGDFGLARLLPQLQQGVSSSTITIKGTIGYAAPEYAMGLMVSTQGDVYSYGILLLEMFTGKRPTNDAFTDGLDLHNYVRKGLYDQVWNILDPSLLSRMNVQQQCQPQDASDQDDNTKECLVSVLKIGIECSQAEAKDRMDMKKVTRELHFIRDALRVH